MDLKIVISILAGTIFINNFVLSQALGLCPFIGVSDRHKNAVVMGFAVIFVMTISSLTTHLLYKYVLLPYNFTYLKTVSFILIIASVVQLVELVFRKLSPSLYNIPGIFIPLITTNCAVLGVALLNINSGFVTSGYGPLKSGIQGFGGGTGFALAILLMSGIRERLELADIPENLKGLPISFITAGILALAFIGFAGMKI